MCVCPGSDGIGGKYGIYNITKQGSYAARINGMLNHTEMYGTTFHTANLSIPFWDTKYAAGFVNQAYVTNTSNGGKTGLYNKLYSYGAGDGQRMGFRNETDMRHETSDDHRYGIYNYYRPGSGNGSEYALYSNGGGNQAWAGYFVGNVHVEGTITETSDNRRKENIRDLEGGIDKIKKLKPKKYNMKNNNSGKNGYGADSNHANDYADGLINSDREHFGFIAQDMQKNFPELVVETISPGMPIYGPTTDEKGNESEEIVGYEADETILGLNYIAIIPILTQALQEQQRMMEEQKEIINDLKSRILRLERN